MEDSHCDRVPATTSPKKPVFIKDEMNSQDFLSRCTTEAETQKAEGTIKLIVDKTPGI